jgi:hypothetical protein
MATIDIDVITAEPNIVGAQQIGRWGRGDFMLGDLGKIKFSAGRQFIYRGLVGIDYVYNVGSPPTGATNIVIIGRTAG